MTPTAIPETQKLFDINAAVEYLRSIGATGVTKSSVRSLIATGGLPTIKLGRKFYITRTSLLEWLSRHERRLR